MWLSAYQYASTCVIEVVTPYSCCVEVAISSSSDPSVLIASHNHTSMVKRSPGFTHENCPQSLLCKEQKRDDSASLPVLSHLLNQEINYSCAYSVYVHVRLTCIMLCACSCMHVPHAGRSHARVRGNLSRGLAEKRSTKTTGPAQLLLLANLQRQIELLQSNTNSRAVPTTTIPVQQLQQQV